MNDTPPSPRPSISPAVSLVFLIRSSPVAWAVVFKGAVLDGLYETKPEADAHLDSLLRAEGDTRAATPIQRAMRAKAVIRWLRADLPGCGNSLGDLASGYASWLSAPIDEVAVGPSLIEDADFIEWVYTRFSPYVNAHTGYLL